MKREAAMEQYWHWFCAQLFSDPGLERRLLDRFGTPETIFKVKEEELLKSFPGNQGRLSALCVGRKNGILAGRQSGWPVWIFSL